MSLRAEEEKAMHPRKRLAVLRAEQEGRLAALEGGASWADHGNNLKWLAAEIYELEQVLVIGHGHGHGHTTEGGDGPAKVSR